MGPLKGVRIIEIAGIGPAPFGCMLLADLGAEIIRIDRLDADPATSWGEARFDVLGRGKRSVRLDLKRPAGIAALLRLVETADALVEGFRPGVAERMGFGPEVCLERNPRLVFGRMTGWGQEGPMASAAGHDINYIALTGALAAIGPKDGPPSIPLNYVGDFGGGGIYLALGVVSAILEASRSGRGQVVDTAMVDGAASLSALFYVLQQIGYWQPRGGNFLDGGAPFYGVYETKDGKYVSIGALEGKFFKELLERLEITDIDPAAQHDPGSATRLRERFTAVFLTRTRDEWCSVLEGTDACFAPVLEFGEAADHPHMAARGTFTEIEGVRQPVPAPRFDRTPATIGCPPPNAGQDTAKVLSESGFSDAEIRELAEAGVTGDDPNS